MGLAGWEWKEIMHSALQSGSQEQKHYRSQVQSTASLAKVSQVADS